MLKKIILITICLALLSSIWPAPIARAAVLSKAPNNLGLAGYWSFNDGSGNVATDFSGSRNNGVFSGTNVMPGWAQGKHGQALNFTGTDGFVNVPDSGSLKIIGDLTISMWVYPTNITKSRQGLIHKSYNNEYSLTQETDGALTFYNGDGAWEGPTVYPSGSMVNNQWVHVVVVRSLSAKTLYPYKNGVPLSQVGFNKTPISSASPVKIGTRESSSFQFAGIIDDVRIYNRALSATEVQSLYNSGAVTFKVPSKQGLVGYWPLDDNSGNIASDFSGNGKTATLNGTNGLPVWVYGKRGKALQLDGVDDFISSSSAGFNTTAGTVSMWVKMNNFDNVYGLWTYYKEDVNRIRVWVDASKTITFFSTDQGSSCNKVLVSGTPSSWNAGEWHYITTSFDYNADLYKIYFDGNLLSTGTSSCNAPTMALGDFIRIGALKDYDNTPAEYQYLPGSIDDVRIYNGALTPEEIMGLYKSGEVVANASQNNRMTNGLVGYWSFNGSDVSGTAAYDRSGSGNNGTVTGGPKTVIGKVGQGLSFNGQSGYVEMNNPLLSGSNFTISMWYYPTRINPTYDMLYSGTDNIDLQMFFHQSSKKLTTSIENVEIPTNLTLSSSTINQWYHVVWTYDYSRRKVYINGALDTDSADTTALTMNDARVRIGALLNGGGYPIQGVIDEVRVYNRALTPTEIQQLYNMGK